MGLDRSSNAAIVGAISYPLLLLFAVGTSFSPFNPESPWGLAAEHGELQIEHWSHFMVAIVAAIPLAVASKFTARRVALLPLLVSSLVTVLPYLVQPVHAFDSNDSWLATYAWQIDAAEVALAPPLLTLALALAFAHTA